MTVPAISIHKVFDSPRHRDSVLALPAPFRACQEIASTMLVASRPLSPAQDHPTVILSDGWRSGRERRIPARSGLCAVIRAEILRSHLAPHPSLRLTDGTGSGTAWRIRRHLRFGPGPPFPGQLHTYSAPRRRWRASLISG